LISALQLLAQSGAASADGVICLAIEEPELFQHPIQVQTFAKVLRDLAEDEGKRIQVTYPTHGPYFLEAKHFDQVRRLSRTADEIPVVAVHWATLKAVKVRLVGILKPASVERQLDGVVTNRLGVALFAHRALLVEGPTDAAVVGGIADKSGVGSLEASGLSVVEVEVGGKTSIPLAHAILTELGILAYALFDADQGYQTRATVSGKDPAKIVEERSGHVAANRMSLKYFALADEDFPAEFVGESVAIFVDHIEAFIEQHWPEWGQACRDVEAASGVMLAKNQSARRTATLQAGGSTPQMLMDVIARSQGAA
jgi:predicted ATP-dependent endonuclease of OLD family